MRRNPPFVPTPRDPATAANRATVRPSRSGAAWIASCTLIAAGCATPPHDWNGDSNRTTETAKSPPLETTDARATATTRWAHGPHDSLDDFLESHLSGPAWSENVVDGYLGTASVLLPAGLALAAAGVSPVDRKIADHARDTSPGLGHVTLAALLAGTAAVGVFAPGEGRAAAEERWNIVESLLLTVTVTQTLSLAVGRGRPDSSNDSSFPSGHTSTAFAAATLIDRNSGHWYGVPAYVLASATALSRVEARRHFPSDVLAGAALGCLTAGIVDSLHFGGDDEGRGISRRGVSTHVGFELDPDGRPTVALTLGF